LPFALSIKTRRAKNVFLVSLAAPPCAASSLSPEKQAEKRDLCLSFCPAIANWLAVGWPLAECSALMLGEDDTTLYPRWILLDESPFVWHSIHATVIELERFFKNTQKCVFNFSNDLCRLVCNGKK
jgi:hypothetical protein